MVGTIEIGEGFAGEGTDAAHVNTVLGAREGPVGAAFATALATPSAGHVPFLVVARPGLALKPATLFVNKAALAGDVHARLTWGAAQAGVAAGVGDALRAGSIDPAQVDALVLIAAIWVDPRAGDEARVHANNREATRAALAAGRLRAPALADVLEATLRPWNPFFAPRRA